jgi:hypothetical protein
MSKINSQGKKIIRKLKNLNKNELNCP